MMNCIALSLSLSGRDHEITGIEIGSLVNNAINQLDMWSDKIL